MKEFKGTKGEWYVEENTVMCNKSSIAIVYIKNCNLGNNGKLLKDEEMLSNSKLIAAAPNLLDRLNKLVLSVKAHPDYVFGEDGDEWHDLISLSEQAIKKATE